MCIETNKFIQTEPTHIDQQSSIINKTLYTKRIYIPNTEDNTRKKIEINEFPKYAKTE